MSTYFRVDYVSLGKHIRSARLEKHLTQAQLAEITGLSEKHIGNIERATRIPSIDALVSICIALNIQPERLLCDSFPEDMLMLREIKSKLRSALTEQYHPQAAENDGEQPADLSALPSIGFVSIGERIPEQFIDLSPLFKHDGDDQEKDE